MINESLYRRTEGILYGYYRRKNKIMRLNSRLIRIQNRIDRLRKDIRECNIELGETISGTGELKYAMVVKGYMRLLLVF